MNTIEQILQKYTLTTDIVKKVEATTKNHYCANERFEVIRNNQSYFISIKKVDVVGQVIKSHVRLEVDTNLPANKIAKVVDVERIQKLQLKLTKAQKTIIEFKNKFPENYKNFTEYYSANKEEERIIKLIEKLTN
jgi:hypothetical protein